MVTAISSFLKTIEYAPDLVEILGRSQLSCETAENQIPDRALEDAMREIAGKPRLGFFLRMQMHFNRSGSDRRPVLQLSRRGLWDVRSAELDMGIRTPVQREVENTLKPSLVLDEPTDLVSQHFGSRSAEAFAPVGWPLVILNGFWPMGPVSSSTWAFGPFFSTTIA
jgi:hypothetical protein